MLLSNAVTISFTATDTNNFARSAALGFLIISLPATGQLYQTPDGWSLGSAISALGTAVTNANCSIIYVNTQGSIALEGGVSVLYSDSFQFQAQVTYNGTTVQASQANTVTLSITNSMLANANTSSLAYTPQNSSNMVLLHLTGSNLLGGSCSYIVQQLPVYVSSSAHHVTPHAQRRTDSLLDLVRLCCTGHVVHHHEPILCHPGRWRHAAVVECVLRAGSVHVLG